MTVRAAAPRVLSGAQVAQHAATAGFKGEALVTIVAIAYAESTWDAHAVGDVDLKEKGEQSTGLWQVHYRPSRDGGNRERDPQANLDPTHNARSAYSISRGGTSFKPWTMYTNGQYAKHVAKARAAVGGRVDSSAPAGAGSGDGVSIEEFIAAHPEAKDVTAEYDKPNVVLQPQLPPQGLTEVVIGSGLGNDLLLTGGELDLSIDEVSRLRLEYLDDKDLRLTRSSSLQLYRSFKFRNTVWSVTSREVSQVEAGVRLRVDAQGFGVRRLRATPPNPVQNISPSEYLRQAAAACGMRAVVEPSAVRSSVGPEQVDDADLKREQRFEGKRTETTWEVGQRLAGELGYLFFEVNNTLYFGRPLFLAEQTLTVQFTIGSAKPRPDLGPGRGFIGVPTMRRSKAREVFGPYVRYGDLTLRGTLTPLAAGGLRPALNALVHGGNGMVGADELLQVRRLTIDLSDPGAPVSIELADYPAPTGGTGRTPADDAASPAAVAEETVAPSPIRGGAAKRLNDYAERNRIFGPPGDRARLAAYRTPWGITVSVNRVILPQFKAACDKAASVGWRPQRIDNYVVRNIAGTSTPSLHGYGLAFDFFATGPGVVPPGGVYTPQNAVTPAFAACFIEQGFFWGRNFRRRPDVPHIEWAGGRP